MAPIRGARRISDSRAENLRQSRRLEWFIVLASRAGGSDRDFAGSNAVSSLVPTKSLPLRLGLLVAGMVFPLTVFAAVLVYYNYEANRRTAYDRILQIARGLATNIDTELRATIASLQVLALSQVCARDDLEAFRKQAEQVQPYRAEDSKRIERAPTLISG